MGSHAELQALAAQAPVDGKDGDNQKLTAAAIFETPVQNDTTCKKLGRVLDVTLEGAGAAIPGVWHAIESDFHDPGQFFSKLAGGAVVGGIMKVALPAEGVGKAVAGTIMLGYMAIDAVKPIASAVGTAWRTDNAAALSEAARNMGNGLGSFVEDSAIGIAGGKLGELGAGALMERSLGAAGYSAFEAYKDNLYNKRSGLIGRFLVPFSEGTDTARLAVKNALAPEPAPFERLTGQAAVDAVNEAANHLHQNIFKNPVYRSQNFSEFVDGLTGEGPEVPMPTQAVPNLDANNARVRAMMSRRPDVTGPDVARVPPGEAGDPEVVIKLPGKIEPKPGAGGDGTGTGAGDAKGGGGGKNPVTTPAQELEPSNLKAMANEAAKRQNEWAQSQEDADKGLPSKAALADFRDSNLAPISDASDASRSGRVLAPEYDRSAKDLVALIGQIRDAGSLEEAGMLIQLHGLAAGQAILGDNAVLKLNLLAREMHGDLAARMREMGVEKNPLNAKVPSVFTISDDRGAGNFTIPAIDKVLHRPVTLFPRNQTELLDVFAPINYHENYGHDNLYPMIARFDDQYRLEVLTRAVTEAFKTNKIADTDFQIGDKTMKKSELFRQLLIAQANENTADMIGTAKSGMGTPLSLGVLLQSLRRGGILETRNVYSSQFPDTFEAHGLDRWRIKLSAQVMRQLGGSDSDVAAFANGLDAYADKASRPGTDYVYASVDNKGEKITFSQKDWDAVIPEIVKAQFTTPLPALETSSGRKTLTDLCPDFVEMFKRTNGLATQIADAAGKGSDTVANFNPTAFQNQYTIGNVFNASLIAWARAGARGEEAGPTLDAIRGISGKLTDLYLENNPHEVPITPTVTDNLWRAPLKTVVSGIVNTTGNTIGAIDGIPRFGGRYSPYVSGAFGSQLTADLINMHKKTQEVLQPAGAIQEKAPGS